MRILCVALLMACSSSEQEPSETRETSSGAEHTVEHHGHQGHQGQGHHHDFSDVERFEAIFDAPDRDAWQKPDEVVALMQLRDGLRVVDLGAGTGYFLSRLSAAVGSGEVLALDVEPAMVEHMNTRIAQEGLTNVRAQRIGTDSPELEAQSVDAILIVDTWHHIESRESYAGLLRDALVTGGSVWVVDFTLDAPQGPPAQMRIGVEQTAAELRAAGLNTDIVAESLPYQYIVRATRE